MEFHFKITEAIEVDAEQKKIDLMLIEKYLNERLSHRSFGSSVDAFYFGYELFSYNGQFKEWFQKTRDTVKYSWKNRYLLSVSQFDWDEYKSLNERGQFLALKKGIIRAVDKLSGLKKKPGNFSLGDFKSYMREVLEQCERECFRQ